MLHPYPIAAAAENWVHEALVGKVRSVLDALNAEAAVPTWDVGMPAQLQGREALSSRYDIFCAAAANLTQVQRDLLGAALEEQNNFPAVFQGAACPPLSSLPAPIHQPIRALFKAGFDALRALNIRDRQYSIIWENLPGKACPFCGIEPFEAPGLAREDLDHYLPESVYPFAGANLRNLTPMGSKCNSSYKLATDILHNGEGLRRRCFDPYGAAHVEVSLLSSRPFEGAVHELFPLPLWVIELIGDDPEAVETWADIFRIRPRYEGNVLDAFFKEWMQEFAYWCQREVAVVATADDVVAALNRYLDVVVQQNSTSRNFLRRAMFTMMRHHCRVGEGADRLVAWIVALVDAERQFAA